MAASSTAAAFVVALKAALVTRFAAGALSSVLVELVLGGDNTEVDRVVLLRAPTPVAGGQEYVAMGNRREDAYKFMGAIQTYATDPNTDVAFQASWDRAALILDEIILQLRDNQTLAVDTVKKGMVTDISYRPFPSDKGGWVTRCEYTIEYGSIVS